jgi:PadR family transcriptional regulator PadR
MATGAGLAEWEQTHGKKKAKYVLTSTGLLMEGVGPRSKVLTRRCFLYIVYLMIRRDYLGEFEHIVVLALLRLGDRAYGVTVRQEIETRTRREVSIGAIYATLARLAEKGYVKSHLGDPTPERGGRSKRFFQVTTKGVLAVNRTHRAIQNMTAGLDLLERYS